MSEKKEEYDINADLAGDVNLEKRQTAAEIEAEQKNFNNEEPPDCLTCNQEGMCYPICIEQLGINPLKFNEPTSRIIKALKIAMEYGPAQGAEHKAYAMDQIVRSLLGDQYDEFVKIVGIWDKGVG